MSVFSSLKFGGEKYPALTGIRAVGATTVFLDHFPPWPSWHITINVMAFFFVLSGFLIVRIYYETAELRRHWLSKYFVNRFARIYPVYFLLLSVAVCLQHDFSPWTLVTNYTLTHSLFHHTNVIIQPSWSLTVEECFYAMAPLLMLLARRRGFWAPFLVGCALFVIALWISTRGVAFLGTPIFLLDRTFFGHFMEFFAGSYLALVLMRKERAQTAPESRTRYTQAGLAGVLLLAIAMVIVYRAEPFHISRAILINNFLIPVPIAVLYFGLMREQSVLSRLLSGRIFGLLGRSSYSFYLLHMLMIDYVSLPLLAQYPAYHLLCVAVTLIVTWGLSILLFALYEEPLNLLIRQALRSKEQRLGIPATVYQPNP